MDQMTPDEVTAWIERQIDESIAVQQAVRAMAPQLGSIALKIAGVLDGGGRVFIFGNGGSAADAQHWAAELSGRFYLSRPSLPVFALGTNISQVTAVANDYGFEEVFARPLAGMAKPGDVAIAISTSGRSRNIIRALETGRATGLYNVGFTGASGAEMAPFCDDLIRIPTADVARIQEGHELCGHVICAVIERTLFGAAGHDR